MFIVLLASGFTLRTRGRSFCPHEFMFVAGFGLAGILYGPPRFLGVGGDARRIWGYAVVREHSNRSRCRFRVLSISTKLPANSSIFPRPVAYQASLPDAPLLGHPGLASL